ncbi:MAG: hypothetical protein DMD93_16205 [Candidatus Rokuibacteriota bacterium]|nr:MAG: hypothetical protein DMD93_16205 [Candidatus Rokubacteria bacterium]
MTLLRSAVTVIVGLVALAGAIPGGVQTMASLAFAARSGLIYVNVLTTANPEGEVRGQLLEQ